VTFHNNKDIRDLPLPTYNPYSPPAPNGPYQPAQNACCYWRL